MLTLYHAGPSVSAIKVRLVLHEKNLPWESKLVQVHRGDQFSAEYRKLNPNAVVPTLVHDGRPIIESTVIIEYLEDAFPAPPLLPRDPYQKAMARLWMKKVDDYLHAACNALTFAIAFRPILLRKKTSEELEARFAAIPDSNTRDRQRQAVLLGLEAPQVGAALRNYDKFMGEMEEALAHSPCLAGDSYSLADVAATPYVNRAPMLALDGILLNARPRVVEWFKRIRQRPSFEAAIESHMTERDREYFRISREEIEASVRKILRPPVAQNA
jgi:glutathione S-transferase